MERGSINTFAWIISAIPAYLIQMQFDGFPFAGLIILIVAHYFFMKGYDARHSANNPQ